MGASTVALGVAQFWLGDLLSETSSAIGSEVCTVPEAEAHGLQAGMRRHGKFTGYLLSAGQQPGFPDDACYEVL